MTEWGLCLGYGDLVADAALGAAAAIRIVVPVVGLAASTWVSIVANTDIVITDSYDGGNARGLATHEYGHYALCDLTRKNGDKITADLILSLDTIAGGSGNPDPDEEARVVNEAFADFFSMQMAGGVNYGHLQNKPGMFRSNGLTLAKGGYRSTISTAWLATLRRRGALRSFSIEAPSPSGSLGTLPRNRRA